MKRRNPLEHGRRKPITVCSSRFFSTSGPGRSVTAGKRSTEHLSPLHQLAKGEGILLHYRDMAGETLRASPETLRALLQLFGLSADHDHQVRAALVEQEQRHWRELLSPIAVAWDSKQFRIDLRQSADFDVNPIRCRIHFEDGRVRSLDCHTGSPRVLEVAEIEGKRYISRSLTMPGLPLGYHQLEIEQAGRVHRCLIISAPTRSYSPPEARKTWGVFLPMYAAHSAHSWGAGNLGAFRRLADWTASLGGRAVATLPLLPTFLEHPTCDPSPYAPGSRLFWNEFYLDIARVPELARCPAAKLLVRSAAFQNKLAHFRDTRLVDYGAEMRLRREVLEPVASFFFSTPSSRRDKFEKFLAGNPRMAEYAAFRATCDRSKVSWQRWDERLREGKLQAGDYSESRKNYYLFTQWITHEQMTALSQHCERRNTELYLDLPLGVHSDGYDIWRERDAFAFPARVGAPPDVFFTKGQDWGFAPLHPRRNRLEQYRYFLDYLRFNLRHAAVLRLDHIMGFHRLYWIPPGFPASQGAYVGYPAEEFHAMLCLESHRQATVLVGENLGTVPAEVNQAMARHQFRETYVLQYEQQTDSHQSVRPPPRRSVAGLNSHDMPTFAAHWNGLDIEDRAALGLITRRELRSHHEQRTTANAFLVGFLRRKGFLRPQAPSAEEVLRACLEWLAAGPAEFVLVNLEDLWLETRPQNVPGTCAERPNWRRKSQLSLEQIQASKPIRELLQRINALRPEKQRAERGSRPSVPFRGLPRRNVNASVR